MYLPDIWIYKETMSWAREGRKGIRVRTAKGMDRSNLPVQAAGPAGGEAMMETRLLKSFVNRVMAMDTNWQSTGVLNARGGASL